MKINFRMLILALAGLALALSGCSPAAPAAPSAANPTSQPQEQPVELKSPATEVVEQPTVPAPAPAAESASLDGLVWDDLNRDGIQDLQELGIPNVTVNLLDSGRAAAGTAITDINGAYRFQDLASGDYFVNLQLPTGYVFSPQDQGVNELVDSDVDPGSAETIPVPLAPGENGLVFTAGIYNPAAAALSDAGTVKPPPPEIDVCNPGSYPLGGTSTISISQFASGYCLHAYLWNHGFAIGRIPGGVGRILTDVTFMEFFYQGNFVYQYNPPGETDSVQVCFRIPPGTTQPQIYFFDHFGPRFGHPHQGGASWQPLQTTIQGDIACAAAQTSGAYTLIGK